MLPTRHPASPLDWQTVDSSNVDAVAYDPDTVSMFVRYRHGGIYLYREVSAQRFQATLRAPSVGSYLERMVKPNYASVKIA